MKKICELTLVKNENKDVVEISKDDKGAEIKITKTVLTPVTYRYFIKKPTRLLIDENELFYNSTYWDVVKKGVMPASQLKKRFLNDGGVLSEDQKNEYSKLYDDFFAKQAEHKSLEEKSNKTTQEVETSKEVYSEVVNIFTKIQTFENQAGDLYQNTAEAISGNRSVRWWMLFLSYEDLGNDKSRPVFGDGEYSDRLKKCDEIEEGEDEYKKELMAKLMLATSLWHFGKAKGQEDFDLSFKIAESQGLIKAAEILADHKITEDPKNEKKPETTNDTTTTIKTEQNPVASAA